MTQHDTKPTIYRFATLLAALFALTLISGMMHAQTFNVLYSFQGGTDGMAPNGNLTLNGSSVYGETLEGGNSGCYHQFGCGTIFGINLTTDKETVFYRFSGKADGSSPLGGLLALAAKGYGVTGLNNFQCSPCPASTIFQIDGRTGRLTTLYTFGSGGAGDASDPSSPFVTDGANLYGTSAEGGISTNCNNPPSPGCGSVYQYNIASRTETVVLSFQGADDGRYPWGNLVRDAAGNLYGITRYGGSGCQGIGGCGTVFQLTPGSWAKTILYNFQGGNDGQFPAGLLLVKGNLYGFTTVGGTNNFGTLFQVNPITRVETVLHSFTGGANDGLSPTGLVVNNAGTLYGVTQSGGGNNFGTVFSYDAAGFHLLHSFAGGTNGSSPSKLITDNAGHFYGVAGGGIVNSNCSFGCGLVYELTTP